MKRLISALRRLLRWIRNPKRENHRRLRRSIRRQLIGTYRHQNLRIQQWAKDRPDDFC